MDNPGNFYGQRIVVVGASGSGKTALARTLSQRLNLPHTELDALHWKPGWVMTDRETFRSRVSEHIDGDRWVVDGNYSKCRDLVWGKADTVVYLDYPLWFVFGRLLKRTFSRLITREELWNGNTENWRDAFFSRDSILLWSLQTHGKYRRDYPALFSSPEYAHLNVVRLRTGKASRQWLAGLPNVG